YIAGNNTNACGVQFNQETMNTLEVDSGSLTLSGQVIAATLGSKPFSKVGPGTLILTADNTIGVNSAVNVNKGTLLLGGTSLTGGGIASATTVNINNGALLQMQNRFAYNHDRIGDAAAV